MLKRAEKLDSPEIKKLLKDNGARIRFMLHLCVRCGMCAESCFLYRTHQGDPVYMPSHKMLNSVGFLFRKRGRISIHELETVRDIVFHRCVLCMRCYCPLGVDIPQIIALGRSICRTQGLYRRYDGTDIKP
jgi:Fe-S oxidoreductase